ncbi:MAG TPA: pilin, partial [Flavobacterium sp.]|nr:pilin [Flavobacterium sp.]
NSSLGLSATATDISGTYTEQVTVTAATGVIEARMRNAAPAPAPIRGETITWTPTCSANSGTTWAIGGTIDDKFKPKA